MVSGPVLILLMVASFASLISSVVLVLSIRRNRKALAAAERETQYALEAMRITLEEDVEAQQRAQAEFDEAIERYEEIVQQRGM